MPPSLDTRAGQPVVNFQHAPSQSGFYFQKPKLAKNNNNKYLKRLSVRLGYPACTGMFPCLESCPVVRTCCMRLSEEPLASVLTTNSTQDHFQRSQNRGPRANIFKNIYVSPRKKRLSVLRFLFSFNGL